MIYAMALLAVIGIVGYCSSGDDYWIKNRKAREPRR